MRTKTKQTARKPRTLIKALRAAADKVEADPSQYSWTQPRRCNCGLVAREILGDRGLIQCTRAVGHVGIWSWSFGPRTVCQTTGLPILKTFKTLFKAGLNKKHAEHLEDLGDISIQLRAGLGGDARRNSHRNFIAYVRAWADGLEDGSFKL